MSYFQPYIDSSGIHIPTFSDIRNELILQAQTIFGADIYLESDSQDYQFISIFAAKCYDAMQAAVLAYNNRSPLTAIGTGLDSLVKLNGLVRKTAVNSTATVTVTGTPGTVISNGVIADVSNIKWDLPASVTIPGGGSINVTATCQVSGAIVANPGDLTQIVTPTYGWSSVTNTDAASIGSPVETDSQLRARQAISTSKPSLTRLEATKGGIAEVSGVTRYVVYENDTASTDSNGIPAHSICAVVEGGTDADVAQAIWRNKGVGGGTYGTTTVNVTDSFGGITPIKLTRPTYKDIDVVVDVKALTGYTSDITDLIRTRLKEYLDSLQIGEDVRISSLWGIALGAMPDLKTPMFSITGLTASLHFGVLGTTDITIAYNQVTRGNLSNILINVT